MKTRKRGEPFGPGYEIQSLTVLSVKSEASRVCDWRYTVQHSVCGHETVMTHKSVLQRRAQKHSGLCPTCGNIRQVKLMARRRVENQARAEAEMMKPEDNVALAHKLWPTATGTPKVW